MTELIFKSGAGDFYFDGSGAILSRFDVGHPQVSMETLQKNSGAEFLSPVLGEGEITVEGYLIPGRLSVSEYKRELSRVTSAAEEFELYADGLKRKVRTKELKFDSSPAFGDAAEHFTLKLLSQEPYFEAEPTVFHGVCETQGNLYFPASLGESYTGSLTNRGSVVIVNDGDALRGFTAELLFTSDAVGFMMISDRQEGTFSTGKNITAGDKVKVDTRHGKKSVTDGNGVDLLNYLDKKCAFFYAYPGKTKLTYICIGGECPTMTLSFASGYLNV